MRPFIMTSLVVASAGCIVEAPGGQSPVTDQRAVVRNVPPLSVKNGAKLGEQVEIVGATVEPGRVLPGETFKVTTFFKVLEPLEVDYLVFVHVEDVDGKQERLNVDHPPANGTYPTTAWKKGETVKDEFNVYVPPGRPVRGLKIYLGLWDPKTDARLPLANPDVFTQHDGNNRILLAQVPVGG